MMKIKQFYIRWVVEILTLVILLVFISLYDTGGNIVILIAQCIIVVLLFIVAIWVIDLEKAKLNAYTSFSRRKKRKRTKIDIIVDNILESVVDFPVCNAANSRVYVLFDWPFSQEYMDKDWFDKEAILYQTTDNDQIHLDGAYFIPINRIKEDD